MSNNLQIIFEKAQQDTEFAKALLFAPLETAKGAGIELNEAEAQALERVSSAVGRYYGEQLFIAAQRSETKGWNWYCLFSCS